MEIKMEEGIISFVAAGCRLARDLESNLCRLKSSPENLLTECEQIADMFTAASHRLRALQSCHVAFSEDRLLVSPELSRDLPVAAGGSVVGVGIISGSSKGKEVIMPRIAGSVAGGGISGGGDLWLPEFGIQGGGASGSAVGEGSSSQKTRKRKDELGKRTIEVAAPLHGNTEIPPDDGYTWRKYGQKWILGKQFPRAYYRCTHQRLYNCPAKKQVQSLTNNPQIFQVTYRGTHTCHMSSTAPASAIPPPPPVTTAMVAFHDVSLPNWFPIELTSQPLNNTSIFDTSFSMYSTQVTSSGGGTTSSNVAVEHGATVVDMADAMFNSAAGNGGDSIDFIFSKYERGESGDAKN